MEFRKGVRGYEAGVHRYDVKRQVLKAGNISWGWSYSIQAGILGSPNYKKTKDFKELNIPQTQNYCVERSLGIGNTTALTKCTETLQPLHGT